MSEYTESLFGDLLGKLLTSIEYTQDSILFTTTDNEQYRLFHNQDCCESVYVESIDGDLNDLLDTPILQAEEVTNSTEIDNYEENEYKGDDLYDSYTWTFYKLATVKGYVTIRWLGTSNGYYSESVTFAKIS